MKSPDPTRRPWTIDDLLHSLGPTIINPSAKQFAKARVLERSLQRHPPAPRWLAAAVLIASSAAAAVTLQHVTSDGEAATDQLPPRVVHGSKAPARPAALNPKPAATATLAPVSAETDEVTTRPPEPLTRTRTRGVAKAESAMSAGSPIPQRKDSAASAGEDPTQVAQALLALRKEGRPEHAQTLLGRYLAENPEGALAEEALALSIEASLRQHPTRAAYFARQYLKRFPEGRFRALALRALASSR